MSTRTIEPVDLCTFLERFRTEEACVLALRDACASPPRCCEREMRFRLDRRAFVCPCGASQSVTRGTPFYRLRVPLTIAFQALGRMMLNPSSISALQLVREGWLRRYETAWQLCMRLRGAIEARLFEGLRFGAQVKVPSGAAAAQVCGRTRADVAAAHVRFAVARAVIDGDPTILYASVDASSAALPPGGGGDDDEGARGMLESFRATLVGTHHGVTARYLWWYAMEHIARFWQMPLEAMLSPGR